MRNLQGPLLPMAQAQPCELRKGSKMAAVLLLLMSCGVSQAKTVDLAQWSAGGWRVTVDGVMGGRSSGDIQELPDGLIFSGNINIKGGGFSVASRGTGGKNLEDYAGIWFEADVITDDLVGGGVFEPPQGVTLQLSDASQELSASFAIPQGNRRGEQTNRASVFLPFSSFVRSIYPRQGPCGNCRLDTSRILEVSVYILFQPGPFSITIRTIKAVQSKDADIPVATPVIPAIQMDDAMVKSFIDTTIERGSVAYNKGNSDVCSAVYDCTMRTIDAASGPSQAVKAVASAAIQKAAPYDWNANDAPAWIYRRGFDTILNAYKGLSPPPEDAYPPVAAGDWAVTAIRTAQVPKVNDTNPDTQKAMGVYNGDTPSYSSSASRLEWSPVVHSRGWGGWVPLSSSRGGPLLLAMLLVPAWVCLGVC